MHTMARNQADLEVRLERLATGLRINRGRDDPAGLIASERLRTEIRTIQQAIENSSRAANVVMTAEGALNEVSALLLDMQALVVATANEAGLVDEEVAANQLQIDSILDSLDRISSTTAFAGKNLLDGTLGYHLSGAPPEAFPTVQIFGARISQTGTRKVTVKVTQSAQTAQISFVGAKLNGTSTTSATTIQIRGNLGSEILTFASGSTLTEVRAAINNFTPATGVSAIVSSPGMGVTTSALIVNSTEVGSDAFVSVSPIGGNFIVTGNNNTTIRRVGVDAGVLVDGQPAQVRGLRADVRAGGLDARFFLTKTFGQTLSSASFTITGGGALFQLTPEISPNGQVNIGFNSTRTTQLGNAVTGLLYTLRSGEANDLAGKNFATAQKVLVEAIDQIASFRGRLGNLQRNVIDPNINNQSVTLENVTASESMIRDADMARELSALTRAEILVQATQRTLQIANTIPQLVLSLLS